jgi:hypothetical protein
MRRRRNTSFHPDLERFEAKQLLSAGASVARAAALGSAETSGGATGSQGAAPQATSARVQTGYFTYRITAPTYRLTHLVPPFQQVLVQKIQPVPGRVYNVLFVVVQNNTGQTFTAANDFKVRLPGFTGSHRVAGNAFPVLTGNQVWKPKTWIVFYVISKKYYPLSPQIAAGFQLDAGDRSSTMVPGPSGIFLRLTYNPATFARTLDWIVAYGQGAQTGNGPPLGLPDTAINSLVSAKTNREDFAGHF